jgi:four helix bundle protein
VGDYKKLRVWSAADQVVLKTYQVTQGFPISEQFGLRAQMRRAAVSIPSNIAEGCGRNTRPQLRQFVRVALGSANELEYQVGLAGRLGFLAAEVVAPLEGEMADVKRMLAGLLNSGDPR